MASVLTPDFGSIKPSQKQQALDTNYLNFTDGTADFAQQYLPEIYEQEIERYGNRTLSGFLRMVGAEMPMTSDQVIWSEQNRLHVSYTDVANDGANGLTIPIALAPANPADYVANVISINQTIVILDPATNTELKALVTASNIATGALTVAPYTAATTVGLGAAGLKIFVYGSEYSKGSTLNADNYQSITPSFTQFNNSPIIIRNKYVVSGSDTAQIGWVEVATEDGTGGYLWYLKGAIEENMLFLNRGTNLAFDDMLAGVGSGAAVYSGGSSFGVFENSEDMALNLGFSGFRRGSYDFYKTDWKYLNDASTRGGAQPLTSSQVGDIQGVLVPAGTSTVYDQVLGTNIRRPFLHVRYRASQADDRRMKNWITGSVGGAYTSDLDAMEVHFLSERCLCVQGANNFVLFTV